MRRWLVLGITAGALTAPGLLLGQDAVQERVIMAGQIQVRSGPTNTAYPTSRLRQGDKVQVLGEAKDQPGWLVIKPPPGSFSWINAKFVAQVKDTSGVVAADDVPVRPGSSEVQTEPNMEKIRLNRGTQVVILGRGERDSAKELWLPIHPPAAEVRYLPIEAIQPGGFVAGSTAAPPLAGLPANAARSDSWTPASGAKFTPTSNAKPVGQTMSLYNTGSDPQSPRWSEWGYLRPTTFTKDNQPVYRLEDRQGKPLLYVATRPGETLRGFVGQMIALYGPISYQSDVRTNYITPLRVAQPPNQ